MDEYDMDGYPVRRSHAERWRGTVIFALAAMVLTTSVAFVPAGAPEGFIATVDESSVIDTQDGPVGDVSWFDGSGTRRIRMIALPAGYGPEVRVEEVGQTVRFVTPARRSESLVVLATIGALLVVLGFVVTFSRRGFGFVKGTGKFGETPPDQVREGRGFYWRS